MTEAHGVANLTPQSIPQTSFSRQVELYESILHNLTEKKAEIKKAELSIKELFNQYDIAIRFKGDASLLGLEDRLTLYKVITRNDLAWSCAKKEGQAFSDIASNPAVMGRLHKKFGQGLVDFITLVNMAFHSKESDERKEEDKERSQLLKDEYLKRSVQLEKLYVDLERLESELRNVEKYIEFCKQILALGGQKQQGGKDQQQQQKQ